MLRMSKCIAAFGMLISPITYADNQQMQWPNNVATHTVNKAEASQNGLNKAEQIGTSYLNNQLQNGSRAPILIIRYKKIISLLVRLKQYNLFIFAIVIPYFGRGGLLTVALRRRATLAWVIVTSQITSN